MHICIDLWKLLFIIIIVIGLFFKVTYHYVILCIMYEGGTKQLTYSCINQIKVTPVCSYNSYCKNSYANLRTRCAEHANASDVVVGGGSGCMHVVEANNLSYKSAIHYMV